jgi:hypothetical protein
MSRNDDMQRILVAAAGKALAMHGVVSLEIGERTKGGVAIVGDTVIVVRVERKVEADRLSAVEDLGRLFGTNNVDVVQASPMQALFANPEKYGVSPATLAVLEESVGFPFVPSVVGVRPTEFAFEANDRATVAKEFSYEPPPSVKLEPLKGNVKLTFHASPDVGWSKLRDFLRATKDELVVGMYELTAPHIGDLLARELGGRLSRFDLVMDKKLKIGPPGIKRDDRSEADHVCLFEQAHGSTFDHAYAWTSSRGATFATDYHVKLAVRDRRTFWLSSGSWQSSNQPNLFPLGSDASHPDLPDCNREWHVIGEHDLLPGVWAKFLEWDFEVAKNAPRRLAVALTDMPSPIVFMADKMEGFPYQRYWEPLDVEIDADKVLVCPLLTPDNFIDNVIQLVEEANDELIVQNQSLNFRRKEADQDLRFTRLTKILAEKSRKLKKFRMLIRDPGDWGGNGSDLIAIWESKDFDTSKILLQPRCHTKGMIVDGRKVLLGSHNLTNAGTTTNRDASLIVESEQVATYYRDLFEHDWSICRQLASVPRPRAILARPDERPPPGMRAYRLWDLLDLD